MGVAEAQAVVLLSNPKDERLAFAQREINDSVVGDGSR